MATPPMTVVVHPTATVVMTAPTVARERDVSLHTRCAATSVVIPADARDLTHVVSRLLACAIV